ncbi:MAG: cation:proton antiporter [Rhodopirellula sp.]|nr:cation:proton antiporter [Rhodopirellula sp.]
MNVILAACTLSMALLLAALFLAFFRVLRGPRLPDRVVALDLVAILTLAMIAVYTVMVEETAFLSAAIVLALVGFLGTVALAYYVQEKTRQ